MAYQHFSGDEIKRSLDQAVMATETMNGLDVDPDVIKARLKVIREIADGLGIDVQIPSNKILMIKRFVGVTNEIL